MTLAGFFRGRTAAPYIEGEVAIPSLGIPAMKVSFLLDTGADVTVLMPDDGQRLAIDFGSVQPSPTRGSGIGGEASLFEVDARIIFTDEESSYVYRTSLAIAEPTEHNLGIPSLLGREILSRWLLRYEAPGGLLAAEVDSADLVVSRSR